VKAILVLEMPSSCDKCPLFGSHYSDMTCRGNGYGIDYPYPENFRQEWCPLRPAPEKMQTTNDFWQGCVNIVRNHCIDEILGDKE
jgi:hypothetical protein